MCLALVFREALTLDAVTAPLVAGADKEDAWRFVGRLSPGASSLQLSFLVSLASGDVGSLRCRRLSDVASTSVFKIFVDRDSLFGFFGADPCTECCRILAICLSPIDTSRHLERKKKQ